MNNSQNISVSSRTSDKVHILGSLLELVTAVRLTCQYRQRLININYISPPIWIVHYVKKSPATINLTWHDRGFFYFLLYYFNIFVVSFIVYQIRVHLPVAFSIELLL